MSEIERAEAAYLRALREHQDGGSERGNNPGRAAREYRKSLLRLSEAGEALRRLGIDPSTVTLPPRPGPRPDGDSARLPRTVEEWRGRPTPERKSARPIIWPPKDA